jgi:uncharacterized OB-fold protein
MSTNTAPAADPHPIKPAISEVNKPFWDACRSHKLVAQQCTQCRELRYPAAAICPNCLSAAHEWRELSGRGELFSFIIVHRGYHAYWAKRVPYNVAFIELEERLRMFSNIVGTPNDALRVGQKVKVAFEERGADLVVPVFEVVGG